MLNSIDELVEWTIYICTKRKYLETRLDKIKTLESIRVIPISKWGLHSSIKKQMKVFIIK